MSGSKKASTLSEKSDASGQSKGKSGGGDDEQMPKEE